ncbi:MAG: hypothetical protein HC936_14865 [Leptolyngbyaceae cyanobacterium SU_3_3]|nr:hypothetical protein [Leptolyngbyaceae cyanobacterium SU_3_3]NJR52479.1 hypothetical protein [Leptolyngbyaceae cyanobacterium CSU_1_3]
MIACLFTQIEIAIALLSYTDIARSFSLKARCFADTARVALHSAFRIGDCGIQERQQRSRCDIGLKYET